MGQTVKGMATAMKGMQVEQIAATMGEFEKQFENMDVTSGKIICIQRCQLIFLLVLFL